MIPDDELLDGLERAAFGYFVDEVNPANGLVADTSRKDSPASIAVVGLALSAYPVAVERGWLAREEPTGFRGDGSDWTADHRLARQRRE